MKEEGYSEDEYVEEHEISLDDLEVITNTDNWEPTDEQIQVYAEKLGLELNPEFDYLYDVIIKNMTIPLPDDWVRAFHKESHELYYINQSNNEIEQFTDIEDKALIEIQELYAEHEKKKKQSKKQQGDKKRSQNEPKNRKDFPGKHKREKAYINPSDDEEDKRNAKRIKDKSKKTPDKTEEYDEEFEVFSGEADLDKQKEVNIDDIQYEGSIKMTPSSSQKASIQQSITVSVNDNIVNKNIGSNDSAVSIAQLKTDYENQKKEELKAYRQYLKNNFKSEYEKLRNVGLENYEKTLIIKKRELRDQIDNMHSEQLAIIEQKLQSQKEKELAACIQLKENSKQSTPKDDSANEQKLKDLVMQRNNLLDQIRKIKEIVKEVKSKKALEVKDKLNKSRKTMDEKQRLKKESMNSISQKDIDTLEKEFNKKIQKDKSSYYQSRRDSKSKNHSKDFDITSIQPILTTFQSTLDNEYKTKCNIIDEEFEKQKQIDIDDFHDRIQKDTDDKIAMVSRENDLLEENYYEELNSIRSSATAFNNSRREEIKEFLIGLSSSFNAMKDRIINQSDIQIKETIDVIKGTIISSKSDEALAMIEAKCEENLLVKEGEVQIAYQKSKSMFELTEKECIQKERALRYFIDICNGLTKKIVENPMIDCNKEIVDMVIDELLTLGKNKLNEYNIKQAMNKNKKLFPFLSVYTGNIDESINEIQIRSAGLNGLIKDSSNRDYSNGYSNDFGLYNPTMTQRAVPSFRYHEVKSDRPSINYHVPMKSLEYKDDVSRPLYQYQSDLKNDSQLQLQSQLKTQSPIEKDEHYYSIRKDIEQKPQMYNYINESSQSHQYQHRHQHQHQHQLNPNMTLSLPNNIISQFPSEEFHLYSRIKDFIMDETVNLDKDYSIVNEQTYINNQLTQINKSGYLDKYSRAFLDEKIKGIRIDQRYKNKYDLFSMIKSNISEVFNFIISNRHRKDVFMEKFRLLTRHIEDYKNYVLKCKKEFNSASPYSSNESTSFANKTPYKTSRETDLNNLNSINRFSLSLAMNERNNTLK